jgi:hypothetical protein
MAQETAGPQALVADQATSEQVTDPRSTPGPAVAQLAAHHRAQPGQALDNEAEPPRSNATTGLTGSARLRAEQGASVVAVVAEQVNIDAVVVQQGYHSRVQAGP